MCHYDSTKCITTSEAHTCTFALEHKRKRSNHVILLEVLCSLCCSIYGIGVPYVGVRCWAPTKLSKQSDILPNQYYSIQIIDILNNFEKRYTIF